MRGVKMLHRHIVAGLLALVLLLTAQAAAVAHAAPGPSGQMELCTGTGPVMVYMDEAGNPTGPPVYCPDYALSLIVGIQADGIAPVPITQRWGHLSGGVVLGAVSAQAPVVLRARGPPVLG